MKLELKYQTSIVFFFTILTLIPKISTGQDNLQTVETAIDSSSASITVDVVTDSSLLPSEKTKPKESNINYWGTAGGALAGWFGEFDLNINKQTFSVQYADFKEYYRNNWGGLSVAERKELGILYGGILTNSSGRLAIKASAGISRLMFYRSDNEIYVYGFPIKGEILYRGKYVGIGIALSTNINSENADIICYYLISLGKLK